MQRDPPTLLVCAHRRLGAGSCAGSGGGAPLSRALAAALADHGLDWRVETIGCLGHCAHGPNVRAAPGGLLLHGCRTEEAGDLVKRLVAAWLAANRP